MFETTKKKPFLYTIFLSLTLLVCYLIGLHVRAGGDNPLWHAMVYQFSHCNFWHMVANVYCLWLITTSGYKVRPRHCLIAYALSVSLVIGGPETEGISGFIYALVGMLSWQAGRIRTFHLWMLVFLGVGFLFPHRINVLLHIMCYGSGILMETHFIPWREKLKTYWK